MAALFFGLKAAVLAIVLEAVIRIGKRALKSSAMLGAGRRGVRRDLRFRLPFPLIILAAAVIGFFGGRAGVPAFVTGGGAWDRGHDVSDAETVLGENSGARAPFDSWSLRVSAVCLVLWLGPLVVLLLAFGPDNASRIGVFFSRWRWSPSAGPMPCWPTSRSRRSSPTAGCSPARCWTDWAWRRRRRAR